MFLKIVTIRLPQLYSVYSGASEVEVLWLHLSNWAMCSEHYPENMHKGYWVHQMWADLLRWHSIVTSLLGCLLSWSGRTLLYDYVDLTGMQLEEI